MGNLVLIGMPGSGKTSVGQLLADKLGYAFVDTDRMVEQEQGRSISTLFAEEGEAFFRALEHRAALSAAGMNRAVISTGGGMVLRPDNMTALKNTGTVIFLDRPPEEIAGGDHAARPLIGGQKDRVFALYRERIALYRRWADHIVKNPASPRECAETILSLWKEAERP